jgi:hypothetical protein
VPSCEACNNDASPFDERFRNIIGIQITRTGRLAECLEQYGHVCHLNTAARCGIAPEYRKRWLLFSDKGSLI